MEPSHRLRHTPAFPELERLVAEEIDRCRPRSTAPVPQEQEARHNEVEGRFASVQPADPFFEEFAVWLSKRSDCDALLQELNDRVRSAGRESNGGNSPAGEGQTLSSAVEAPDSAGT
jgi:hypothetical protein